MARQKGHGEDERPSESIGAATRRLTEATTALTAALKRETGKVVPEAKEALAVSLREAANSLSAASASVGGDRRKERSARTRADLLAAAGRVVEEKGYEGASVGDIAAAAGYTKGALYSNFPSKADLFLALADELLCEGEDEAPPSFGQRPGEVRQRALTVDLLGSADRFGMLLVLEILAYGLRHPEARARLTPHVMRNLDEAAAWVAKARAEGADEGSGAGVESTDAAASREDRDRALAIFTLSVLVPPLAEFTGDPQMVEAAARVIDSLLD